MLQDGVQSGGAEGIGQRGQVRHHQAPPRWKPRGQGNPVISYAYSGGNRVAKW
jgi:hypothetical protein